MEQWQIDRYNKYQAHYAERIAFHSTRIYELRSEDLGLPDLEERIAWHESRIQILRDTSRLDAEEHKKRLANN